MAFPTPSLQQTPRDKLLATLAAMKNERASWDAHYAELSRNILPRSSRFTVSDRNKGDRRHNNIYDNTATRSLRILGAGLMGGASSPARPWFRLTTPDDRLMKYAPVKIWLNEVTRIMLGVFQRSNTYRALHGMYEELACFATGCSVLTDSYDKVIHHNLLTVGEYALAADHENHINALAREFEMTVAQIVARFNYENCSQAVRNLYDRGDLQAWVPVVHIIEPRTNRNPQKPDAQNMPWASTYFEPGAPRGGDRDFLRVSGFRQFRVLAPRWAVTSNDIYGSTCPGMEALGDTKSLQHENVRKAEGIDYQTRPPLQVPTSLRGRALDRLPGGITYYDPTAPQGGVRSMFDVNLRLDHLLEDIRDVRERIRAAFFTDLFMAISQHDGKMTATEVAAINQEQLLQLGPILERLHDELLNPLIEITFARILEAKGPDGESMLPPPPDELDGVELKVEFVSMLAQAQRAINTNAIDRFTFSLGNLALIKPGVIDKLDEDKWADIYADSLGIDPELIVPDRKVALVREERAKQQQAAMQSQLMNQGADTAAKLANTDTGRKSALTDMTAGMR